MRKALSTIFYVISGFLLNTLCLFSFFKSPEISGKAIIIGIYAVLAAIMAVIGLAISRFINWKRVLGILFVSSAVIGSFIIFTIVCTFLDPELKKLLPQKSLSPNPLEVFSDYFSGLVCILALAIIGGLLIIKSPQKITEPLSQ